MKESIKEDSLYFYPSILIDTYYDKAFEESLNIMRETDISSLNTDEIEGQFKNILNQNLTNIHCTNNEELNSTLDELLHSTSESLSNSIGLNYTQPPLDTVLEDSIQTILEAYSEESSCDVAAIMYSLDNLVHNNTNEYYLNEASETVSNIKARTVSSSNIPTEPKVTTFSIGNYTLELADYTFEYSTSTGNTYQLTVPNDNKIQWDIKQDSFTSYSYNERSASATLTLTDSNGNKNTMNISVMERANSNWKEKLIQGLKNLNSSVFDDLVNEVKTITLNRTLEKSDGTIIGGHYDYRTRNLQLNGNYDNAYFLTHEIGHAIDNADSNNAYTTETVKTLFKEMLNDADIKSLLSKNNLSQVYALTSCREFFAEYYASKYTYNNTNKTSILFTLLKNKSKNNKILESLFKEMDTILDSVRTKDRDTRIGNRFGENFYNNPNSNAKNYDKPYKNPNNSANQENPVNNKDTSNIEVPLSNDWDMPSTPDTPNTPSTPNNATPNLPDINLPDMSDLGFDAPDFSGYGSGETNVTEKTDTYTKTGNISEFDNNSFNPEGADADLPSNASSILQAQAEAAAEAAAAKARQEYGDDAQITTSTNITIDENGNYSVEVSITVKDVETTKGDNSTNNDVNTNGTNGSNQGQGGNGLGGNGLGSNYGAGSGNNASSTSSSDWMLDSIPSSGSSSSGSGNSGNNTNTTGTNNYDIDAGWMDELVITPDNTNNNGHTNSNSSDLTGLTNGNPYDNLVIQTPGHDFGEMYIESEWTSLFDDYDTSWDNYLSDYSSMWGGGGGIDDNIFANYDHNEDYRCNVCGHYGGGGRCQVCGSSDWVHRQDLNW